MGKLRNIAFIAIVALLLLSPIANKAAGLLLPGYDLPDHSNVEGRKYQAFPDTSIDAIMAKEFQGQAEQYIADLVPARNRALLANAALQRTAIQCANVVFGYPAYHTFFGSDYIVYPEGQAVLQVPERRSGVFAPEALQEAAKTHADFMNSHPNTNWVLLMVDHSAFSKASPAATLVSETADYGYLKENFLDLLPEQCQALEMGYSTWDDYRTYNMVTDHHLNIDGALHVYSLIADSLGLDPVQPDARFIAYESFCGSMARNGLFGGYSDALEDVSYPHDPFTVYDDGEEYGEGYVDSSFEEDGEPEMENRFSNAYALHFHGDHPLFQIENPAAPDRTLLIIGDSYTNNLERFFAKDYAHIYVADTRWCDNLNALMEDIDPDDAVFLVGAYTVSKKTHLNALEAQ